MNLDAWRRRLREAVADGDGAAIVELLTGDEPTECLQAVGAALLRISPDTPGADAATLRCIASLAERDWQGDAALARELRAHQRHGEATPLRTVPVDLEDLGEVLNSAAGLDGGLVDLETGATWPAEILDNARDAGIDDVPEAADGRRWIEVWPEGHGSRDMTAFVATLADRDLAERLRSVLGRKGAFRGSATNSNVDPNSCRGGMPSTTTARSDALDPGSPTRATGPAHQHRPRRSRHPSVQPPDRLTTSRPSV